ncbi:PrpR N-terminal domain-containing protein [Priestia aryabhattai]|uniref:sigma-54-dependent Fis family transcriptional regulator n=1 Tax=Priestia megaterium TaxID=1404 RepID=UPI0039B8C730
MKVMAIAPYNGLKELMITLGEKEEFELQVEIGDLQEGLTLAKDAVNNDIDIIISRGGTAELIQRELTIPVVEIEVSGYDMLRVLTLAKDYPGKKAIVGFSPISEGASTICEILDINMSAYKVKEEKEIEPILIQLQQEGYTNIIGDAVTVKTAERLGLNGILLTSGKESVLKSFQNAKKIYRFLSSFKKNYLISFDIVQNETEGIVVYNSTSQAIFANPYFNDNFSDNFKHNLNIQDAVKTVCNTGFFETVFNTNNTFWKIKGYPLETSHSKLIVFRINKYRSNDNQDIDGISIVSLKNEVNSTGSLTNIVTKNERMNRILKASTIYADTKEPIWISGEEGTGKERLAKLIHVNSERREHPLLIIDCEVLSKGQWACLLDRSSYDNLLAHNPNGSVVLKNIDSLELDTQKRLASYLKKGLTTCRFIALSRKSMEYLTETQRFDQELYYLLASLTLDLPSLKERKEDIESLALFFIGECNIKFGKQIVGIRNDAKEDLKNFEWIGNIKQLKQIIQESVLLAEGAFLELHDLKRVINKIRVTSESHEIDLTGTLEEIEREIIKKIWLEEGMNQTKTAERLGINRTTLWRKLK